MASFKTSCAGRFFDVTSATVGYEIRPGNTVTFMSEVDLTEAEMLRVGAASGSGAKPSYTALVVKAVALALREFPYANRRLFRPWWAPFSGWRIQQFLNCDVSVACERDLPGTEVAAFFDNLHCADKLTLTEITDWLRRLSNCDETSNRQWRDYKKAVSQLPHWLAALIIRLPVFFPSLWSKWRGGAVLISSPAKYGVDAVLGTWMSPLGVSFGLVRQRAVVRNGKVVVRPTFMLTLNFDRRVMAGAQAARFFHAIVRRLETADFEEASPRTGERATGARPPEAAGGRRSAEAFRATHRLADREGA